LFEDPISLPVRSSIKTSLGIKTSKRLEGKAVPENIFLLSEKHEKISQGAMYSGSFSLNKIKNYVIAGKRALQRE